MERSIEAAKAIISRQLLHKGNITVNYLNQKDSSISRLDNNGITMEIASDEYAITFGYFDDPNLLIAVFFHEIGHIMLEKVFPCDYKDERLCWKYGFMLMKNLKVKIPISCIKKCIYALRKYKGLEYVRI